MKTQTENTKDPQNTAAPKAQQQAITGGTATIIDNRPATVYQRKLQETMYASVTNTTNPIQRKSNKTGLPDTLKSGIENLSGYAMDDVKVYYNSSKPAQLQAHAYAQGTNIHLAPGQEKHLPHEAWHVVQQKQGRVKPTTQLKGKVNINDDAGLEKEADMMGAKANKLEAGFGEISHAYAGDKNMIHQSKGKQGSGVLQRAKIVEWDEDKPVYDDELKKIISRGDWKKTGEFTVDKEMITTKVEEVNANLTSFTEGRIEETEKEALRETLNQSIALLESLLATFQRDNFTAYKAAMKSENWQIQSRQRKFDGNLWKQLETVMNSLVVDKRRVKDLPAKQIVNRAKPALESAARRYVVENAIKWREPGDFVWDRCKSVYDGEKNMQKSKELQAMCKNFMKTAREIVSKVSTIVRIEDVGSVTEGHNWLLVGREDNSDIKNPATWGDDCVTIDLWYGALNWEGDYFRDRDNPVDTLEVIYGNDHIFNTDIEQVNGAKI